MRLVRLLPSWINQGKSPFGSVLGLHMVCTVCTGSPPDVRAGPVAAAAAPDRGLAPGWTGSQGANRTGSGTACMSSTVGSASPSARQPCEEEEEGEGVRRRMRASNAFSPSFIRSSAVVYLRQMHGPQGQHRHKRRRTAAALLAERCARSVARKKPSVKHSVTKRTANIPKTL